MDYTTIIKITKIGMEIRKQLIAGGAPSDLCGYCAIASGLLHKRLKKEKIKSTIIMVSTKGVESHCFLIVEELIVDITATQFDLLHYAVAIHEPNENRDDWYWGGDECNEYLSFPSASALRKCQLKQGWDKSQVAY